MLKRHLKLYKSLNRHKVKYLIIGGIACSIYGSPRGTLDIDIIIKSDYINARNLLKALKRAGFSTASLTTPEKILANEISIFEDYLKLDVFTKVKGIEFEKVWRDREVKYINSIAIKVISLDDLIKSKTASDREIDITDIRILRQSKRLNRK